MGIQEIWNWQVPWPLELIANTEAIKKYNQVSSLLLGFFHFLPWPFNFFHHSDYDVCSCYLVGSFYQLYCTFSLNKYIFQVMRFLLKVKRAKFVLDKVRRWMWKVLPQIIPHFSLVEHVLLQLNLSQNKLNNLVLHFTKLWTFTVRFETAIILCRVRDLLQTTESIIGQWSRNSFILWMLFTNMLWIGYAHCIKIIIKIISPRKDLSAKHTIYMGHD